jgi:hypothetical protein
VGGVKVHRNMMEPPTNLAYVNNLKAFAPPMNDSRYQESIRIAPTERKAT